MARARIANKLNNNPGLGNPVPTPGNVPSEEDMYDTMAYRMAFMRYVCSNGAKELPGEYRSNENTTTTDVGAVIPTTIMNRIVEEMEAIGMILPLVTQTNLRGGVTYPTSTVKPVATWVAERNLRQEEEECRRHHLCLSQIALRCIHHSGNRPNGSLGL